MESKRWEEAIEILSQAMHACQARAIQVEARFQRAVCSLHLGLHDQAAAD